MGIINNANEQLSKETGVPVKIVQEAAGNVSVPNGQVLVVLGDKLRIFNPYYSSQTPLTVKSMISIRGYVGAEEVMLRRLVLGKKGLTPFKAWRLNRYVRTTLRILGAGKPLSKDDEAYV